ncbi:hypothetical protein BN439_1414 [Erwinia amylovora Ea644]|nr:hypothetical protein BN439_1414 [Erwinia amylovora Ea644]CCP06500.1 hypothetical protein BN440_1458 [Erwinia amylovora MR1]
MTRLRCLVVWHGQYGDRDGSYAPGTFTRTGTGSWGDR